MSMAPPTNVYGAQPPSSSTATSTTPSYAYPVQVQENNLSRRSLDHPPNYQQNPYAADLTAEQRMAHEAANAATDDQNSTNTAAFGVDPENAWNTAKQWAQVAGRRISEVETEVWRRINKE